MMYIHSLITIAYFMVFVWLCSLWKKDASLVDRFWGLIFVLLCSCLYLHAESVSPVAQIMAVCVGIWGLRLSLYITIRNWGHGEDHRYQAMRSEGGRFWPYTNLFTIFFLQGFLASVFAGPIYAAFADPEAQVHTSLFIGIGIFVFGFLWEAVADWQLLRFKAKPENQGKLLTDGLWSLSRHPNYFGEATLWWGIYVMGLSTQSGVWRIYSPILLTIFLLRVSGVSLLEKRLVKSKPGYEAYIASTPAFFPRIPLLR